MHLNLRAAPPLLAALVLGLIVNAAADDRVNPADSPEWLASQSPDVAEFQAATLDEPSAPALARSPMVPAAQQPAGALRGRIVFMNSGHGWIFDPTYWRLQRPIALNEMNEDYGNLDQLNLFAAYCFNAGAVVVSMRPLGQQTNEVVLDNDDPGVSFAGPWSNSSSSIFFGSGGDLPYRFASLNASETATGTYTPTVPVTGYYPVYTWVRHGPDRADQLYRIRHTGGETQLRIPHYLVGNGWIYLGEYYFNAGSNALNGSVAISNLRGSTNGSVVIADAIRFGNGMGSLDRGGGISRYPREEESCRYWIEHNLGQGQPTSVYESAGDDELDSWSAPPKMSAEMNREASGSMFKRIHISFHSNGGGGRGTVGLITGANTPNQAALAQICGQTVNDELVGLGSPPLEHAWFNRGAGITFSGGYSEISSNNIGNEMDATIIEVAYHDNATDAALMRDPKARGAVARAAMHSVIQYMNQFDLTDPVPLLYPPEPPVNVRTLGQTNGAISLSWAPPVTVANSGAPTNYVIYQSTNGYGFGNPINAGNTTNFVISNLTAGREYSFRVAAANAAGESFPSEVVGCRTPPHPTSPRVLYVNAFDRFDRTTNLRQNLATTNYVPPGASGGSERVLPRRVNSFDYVVAHGQAISAYGMPFDTCQNEDLTAGLVALANYPIVIWACGNESTADESFSSAEQSLVTTFLAGGGHLFASGSEIAWDLDRSSGPTSADRNFINNQLRADYVADSSGSWTFNPSGASIFAGNSSGIFDNGNQGIYLVGYPDVLTPLGGATTAIAYSSGPAGAAAVVYNGPAGTGKVVYFGFPFETITSAAVRNEYMADILSFFGANIPPSIAQHPVSQTVKAGSNVTFSVTGNGTTVNYQWFKNAVLLNGATNASLTLSNVQTNDSGLYSVALTNAAADVLSSNATLTVLPLEPLKFDSVELLTGNQLRLVLSGEPGAYLLQTSAVLNAWGDFVAVTNVQSSMAVTNLHPATIPQLYYRARRLP